jgi:hypothetical protein
VEAASPEEAQALLETGEGPPMFAFGELAVWFRPKVVRLEYLMDAEDEEVVRRLRTMGHELHWVLETRLREFQSDGWKPVTKWDKTGRRSIFMDNREELVLLHRRPAEKCCGAN